MPGTGGVVQGRRPKGKAVRISERPTGIDPDLVCQPEEQRTGRVEAPSPLTLPSTLCQSTATLLGHTATSRRSDVVGRGHLHGQTHNRDSPACLKMAATST